MSATTTLVSRGLKGIGNKVANSLKSAALDYRNAATETWASMRKMPLKAVAYSGIFSLSVYLARSKPSEKEFIGEVTEEITKMSLLSDCVRNKESNTHLQNISRFIAKGQLRYRSLMFFSVIYSSEYDINNKFYESQCKYLKPKWLDITNQILDVGCCGKWWVLRYKMADYDIDFDELPKDIDGTFDVVKDVLCRLFGVSYFGNPVVPVEEQSKRRKPFVVSE